ncbi:MAG: hypothetical protein IT328_20025 [Caldilineaceae bacterium]|nr:hypothetical protein [Caldilineaceae bacterium]
MEHVLAFEMPTTYDLSLGTPFYWRNEVTGILGDAIFAYICHKAEPENFPAPREDQLALVIAYLRYVINAPCWHDSTGRLAQLRAEAKAMATVAEVGRWIIGCVEIGIDPL